MLASGVIQALKTRLPGPVYGRLRRLYFSRLNVPRQLCLYGSFASDWRRYSRMPGAEPLHWRDAYPVLDQGTAATGFDQHYFYQDAWAFRKIAEARPSSHVDVGSNVRFVGMLTAITHVTFIDIRPLLARIPNLDSKAGSVLDLPYLDGSLLSLSCLHVAEHVGLGRYGDPLDPQGTRKAAAELARVLRIGGHLYFGLPVGRPRVCFNAHRIHSPQQVLEYFGALRLVEFSGVNDPGEFLTAIRPADFANQEYACGLFHFTKEGSAS